MGSRPGFRIDCERESTGPEHFKRMAAMIPVVGLENPPSASPPFGSPLTPRPKFVYVPAKMKSQPEVPDTKKRESGLDGTLDMLGLCCKYFHCIVRLRVKNRCHNSRGQASCKGP